MANKYTKQDLLDHLKKANIDKHAILMVHSSMKSVGDVEGRADTVLDAFSEYMADGLLVFAAHSYDTMKGERNQYYRHEEPSCVGLLPNLFLKRENTHRSYHPTHSMTALGKGAEEFIAGEEKITTPCGRAGCWGKLLDNDAQIMFLGCSLNTNTFLHGVEEWVGMPGRIKEEISPFEIMMDDGSVYINNMHRHGSKIEPSQFYSKMLPVFLKHGNARKIQIGDAVSYICSAKGMYEDTKAMIEVGGDIFQDDKPLPTDWY